jgi:1-acyl-sn-glycerol-3-phosphate acyltransferase
MTQRSLLWRWLQMPCRILTTLLFDLKVYGVRNVPRDGGVLILSNHQSYLDPVLLAVRLYRPVSFLARSTLFRGGFGVLIRKLHAFPVNQDGFAKAALEETIRRLNEGHVLNVYPEGSRTKTGEIAPVQRGVALILRKAHVPVVIAAIDGSFEAWTKGRKLFKPYPIRVLYGKPMHLGHLRGEEMLRTIETELHRLFNELRAMRSPDRQ